MRDPYDILGVQRSADEAAIRTAYRKLAKRHHPDVNPGKPEAVERFKEISAAYDLLSDKDKRARFDRGEIDAEGHEMPPQRPFYRDYQEGPGAERYGASGGFSQEDIESFFAQAFAQEGQAQGQAHGGGRGGARFKARGRDAHYGLTVSFVDAANGTTRRLAMPDGKTLDVTIPPGTEDGHILRLRGQGGPGLGGGPAGDALIEVAVAPDPQFRREGDDIIVELPVTIREAVLGTSVEVPTIRGPVRVTIPPGSGTGTRLRLRGRGVRQGHQFVELQVVLPPGEEPALAEFLKTWTPSKPFNPREGK
ncbi:DnaJ C-terminal domain-containing protein [Rhodopila sp.]|jgi:DnaJ-class molecular chaperone|uniref:DnaJ C-terminal domain-containing protein n=1 Tax=Rhodopila sp. TaxID=2480087 RepID=UPI002C6D5859|nr:DnaJ C-terminal domain-containing protein [Rhodopila sp.]HVZ08379.1 DnaJ C-terminal domain-containing protein [Rhodopila sp.]